MPGVASDGIRLVYIKNFSRHPKDDKEKQKDEP
jgi:hypothetical protein